MLKPISLLKGRRSSKREPAGNIPAEDKSEEDEEAHEVEGGKRLTDADIYFQGQAEVDYYTGGDGYDPDSEEEGSGEQSDKHSVSDHRYSESRSPDARRNVTSPSWAPEKESAPPYVTNEAGIPGAWQFQIDLAEVLGRHRTELVQLIQQHSDGTELKFHSALLEK